MVRQSVAFAVIALWVLQPARAHTSAARMRIRGFMKWVEAKMSRSVISEVDETPAPGHTSSIVDITFQLLDDEFLLGKHFLHDIADGNHADHLLVLQHRQVADAFVRHQAHAVLYGLLRTHTHHPFGHDLAHRRVFRSLPLQYHLAGIVAFGKNG